VAVTDVVKIEATYSTETSEIWPTTTQCNNPRPELKIICVLQQKNALIQADIFLLFACREGRMDTKWHEEDLLLIGWTLGM
jgi:hypothetical protein